ncbi:hypothetical protein BJ875DRAFT_203787 [Amylocarpus encephaloides]|uniref:Uncharacterized protein n=1 Tax=Amylocarpus encephaloides TaxID=45428 RepID=A0A9P7YNG0_9HELO|nr:hypothetical protein BJ875DRAFT_203787 [Amylocarpus encephaloides]
MTPPHGSVLSSQPHRHISLIYSIQAASLAYLAKSTSGPTILAKARKQYSSALVLKNQALCQPEDAYRDITLMTVILLDFFEKLMEQTGALHRLGYGAKHLEGALMLTKLRGKAQFEDKWTEV